MSAPLRTVSYRTLAKSLRDALHSGAYGPGERLPTEAELSEHHAVSRQTVRRAMQELVRRRPGLSGTWSRHVPGRYFRALPALRRVRSRI